LQNLTIDERHPDFEGLFEREVINWIWSGGPVNA
jgi:hypothetical protein